MPKATATALREIEDALEEYEREVNGSLLTPGAQETYLRYAAMFVRWIKDDFEPGGTLRRRR